MSDVREGMALMKLLMVGDVHVSDRAPSTRTESYTEDILMKLHEVAEIAKREDVDAVVFVGDIFHSKIPKRTSHTLVKRVMQVFIKMPQVLIVPGNHDYDKANPENIHKAPLGVVAMLPNVTLIGLPNKVSAKVAGVQIAGFREEMELYQFPVAPIVVAHAAIFPAPLVPEAWEAWSAQEVADSYLSLQGGHPRVVWYGHIHEPHGVYSVGSYGEYEKHKYEITFANLGAISRGSMYDSQHDRTPQVGLLTWGTEHFEIEAIDLVSARPAEEVFRITEEGERRQDEADKAGFIDALRVAEVEVMSVEGLIAGLRERSDVDGPVRERAVELIEEVSG